MGRMKEHFLGDKEAWQVTRRTDPSTSYDAGAKIIPKLKDKQWAVLNLLRDYPIGMTLWEIEEHFGDHGSTYRTRCSELVEHKLVMDSGRKRLVNGRQRIVWKAT